MMPASSPIKRFLAAFTMLRGLLLLFVLAVAGFELFIHFQGLSQPEAMHQAHLARQIARGEGFKTQSYTPAQLSSVILEEENLYRLNLDEVRDETTARLPLEIMAAALRLTGNHDWENTRMVEGGSYIYAPDRVLAGVSMFFFLLSLFLSYCLLMSLFDEAVAVCSVLLMSCSSLFLSFACSALPQCLMLCFLLSGLMLLKKALSLQAQGAAIMRSLGSVALAFSCFALMVLSNWMALFLLLGLLMYVPMAFRPWGRHLLVACLVAGLLLFLPYLRLILSTLSLSGDAYVALYQNFGNGSEFLLRSVQSLPLSLSPTDFILRLASRFLEQWDHVYSYMGGILVVPFFFLALLYPYKKSETNNLKWAAACMFLWSALGMALFGANQANSSSQIFILLAPLFIGYGLSLVFAMLARRLEGQSFYLARNSLAFLLLLFSVGPKLLSIPMPLYHAMCFDVKARPQWPPYHPLVLNTKLVEQTNAQDVILSDQPWAVAWYADRRALWTPLNIKDFRDSLLPLIQGGEADVQGVLVTPSSYCLDVTEGDTQGGLTGVMRKNADFTPMSIEGMLLMLSPKKNFLFTEIFDASDEDSIASLVSSKGLYPKRVPLLGAQILLYKK